MVQLVAEEMGFGDPLQLLISAHNKLKNYSILALEIEIKKQNAEIRIYF